MKLWAKQTGFTIVELLIVIVVIAILAAITIVAFNGIQDRARLSAAQAELANLAKQAQIYSVDAGAYPNSAAAWKTVFQKANVYDSLDGTNKNFAVCSNATSFAIVAEQPLKLPGATGDIYYFVSSGGGGVKTGNWDSTITGTYYVTKTCNQPTVMPTTATLITWATSL